MAPRPDPRSLKSKPPTLAARLTCLEGVGGNVLVVIGDDGIIMVDAELAPLHDKIKAAITENSSLPVRYLVDTHFHGEQTDGNAPFHRDGAIIWRRTICGYGSLRAPPTGSATAKPTRAPGRDPDRDLCRRDHDGERPRPRGAAHPCHQCPYRRGQLDLYRGRQWYLYGGLFYNNSRYPMIDYANGGHIRGMIRANEAFLKLATADIKIASSRGGVVAGRAQTRRPEGKDRTSSRRLLLLNRQGLRSRPLSSAPARRAPRD